ncbi:MAG: hypothetical protein P4M08_09245 [Oligoflexia bacterium]|nr:hypothetical protein [Oligoflexia bacterium]
MRLKRKKKGLFNEPLKSFERLHKIGQGISLHIQRVQAQLIASQGVGAAKLMVQAMVMLNELSPVGITLFSEAQFGVDQSVTLNIPDLQNFFVKGKVTACKEVYVNPGILQKISYKYRVQIRFEFGSEVERQAVKAYCESLQKQYLDREAA